MERVADPTPLRRHDPTLPPSAAWTVDNHARRVWAQYVRQPDDLAKHRYLARLRDRDEVLFYRLLGDHLDEVLPIVYTPTVARAIERYSRDRQGRRGVFLSIERPELIEVSLRCLGHAAGGDVDLIVVTDGESLLGIGDWGVGGIEIAVGKLTVYTAAAGVDPRRVLPVVLDVGTDNPTLLDDPMYPGNRHPRVRGARYDEFVDVFVATASRLFPQALLHWEDLGAANARRILQRYAGSACTFNDDMQGTAAVALAAAISGVRAAGSRMADQRIVVFGPGTAGVGIADALRDAMVRDGLAPEEATRRIWLVGRRGLLVGELGAPLHEFQRPYMRRVGETAGWSRRRPGIDLADTVAQVRPTILIGTSTVPGAFTEEVARTMAAHTDRPIILPLSNPTSRSEADPADLLSWTEGRALIATGSPFPEVDLAGVRYTIAQANNALIFPGLGLGTIAAHARRVTDGMLLAASEAVADHAPSGRQGAPLLPLVTDLRTVSAEVAAAVARAAAEDGVAAVPVHDPIGQTAKAMWQPF